MNKYSIHHCSWCSQNYPDVDETSKTENPYTKNTTVISLLELLGLSSNLLVRGAFYRLCNDCTELVSYGRRLEVQLQMVQTTVTKKIVSSQINEVKTILKNRTRRWIAEDMMEPGEDGTLLLGQLLANCFATCVLKCRSEGITINEDQDARGMEAEKTASSAPQIKIVISRVPEGTNEHQQREHLIEIQGDRPVEPEAGVDSVESNAPVAPDLQDNINVPEHVEHTQEELQFDLGPVSEPIAKNVALDDVEAKERHEKKISTVGHKQTDIVETAVEKDINCNNACVVSAELDPRVLIGMKTEVIEERLARSLETARIGGQTDADHNSIPTDTQVHVNQLEPAQRQDCNIRVDNIISNDTNEPQPPKRTKFDQRADYSDINGNILSQYTSEGIDVYECSGCAELLQSLKDKVDHENTHKMFQDPDGNMRYKCGICQMELFGYNDLKLHRLTHLTRPFVCDICGKVCQSQESLEQHLKIHDLEMPFKCGCCNKLFLTYEDLILHQQMQAAVPAFSTPQNLNLEVAAEVEIEFAGVSDPPLELEKVRENSSDALRMLNTHPSKPKPTGQVIALAGQAPKRRIVFVHAHRCGGCWKTFKSVMALGNHEKSHLIYRGGSFWYKCKLCSARYSDYMDLRSHRISHPPTRVTLKRVST